MIYRGPGSLAIVWLVPRPSPLPPPPVELTDGRLGEGVLALYKTFNTLCFYFFFLTEVGDEDMSDEGDVREIFFQFDFFYISSNNPFPFSHPKSPIEFMQSSLTPSPPPTFIVNSPPPPPLSPSLSGVPNSFNRNFPDRPPSLFKGTISRNGIFKGQILSLIFSLI